MAPRDEKPLWPYYVLLVFILGLIVFSMNTLRDDAEAIFTQTAPPDTPPVPTLIVVPKIISSELQVQQGKNWMYCLNGTDVDYSIFELVPSGGKLPYSVVVKNSRGEVQSTSQIDKENTPVGVQVYGGETVTAEVWSYGSTTPDWQSEISIPATDLYCKNAPTATPTPSAETETETATPTSRTLVSTPTPTHAKNPDLPTPTGTPTPTSTAADTTNGILTPTPTSVSAISTPTDAPKPTSTPTQKVEPTNTTAPTATPQPTNTPTNTPIVIPRLKDCEDGIDNDEDTLIDYPADPQCEGPNDNQEDR